MKRAGSLPFIWTHAIFWITKIGHRRQDDKPAEIYHNLFEVYWNYDRRTHRAHGPAYICENGTKRWHRHGLLHRSNGPAIEYDNGAQEFWENGRHLWPFG